MNPTSRTSRIAGALYLLSAVAAGVPALYVSSLIVPGNAAATANNILTSETSFRASMVSELVGAIIFIFLVRALHRLLHSVDRAQASLMVTLVLLSVPITFLNALNGVAALTLLHGTDLPAAFGQTQRGAMAMLFLGLHNDGVNLANIFWGLWLFPFGMLVIRSRFLPRILGFLLLIDGFALVAVSLTSLLLPAYVGIASRIAIFPELGELWIMAWLLIKGVQVRGARVGNPHQEA